MTASIDELRYREAVERMETARRPELTVEQLKELAQAGVTFALKDVTIINPPPANPVRRDWRDLRGAIVLRWRLSKTRDDGSFEIEGETIPFDCAAMREGATVYVFTHVDGQPPVVFEDEAHLFPSDALMANIHLLLEQQRQRTPETSGGGNAGYRHHGGKIFP